LQMSDVLALPSVQFVTSNLVLAPRFAHQPLLAVQYRVCEAL